MPLLPPDGPYPSRMIKHAARTSLVLVLVLVLASVSACTGGESADVCEAVPTGATTQPTPDPDDC